MSKKDSDQSEARTKLSQFQLDLCKGRKHGALITDDSLKEGGFSLVQVEETNRTKTYTLREGDEILTVAVENGQLSTVVLISTALRRTAVTSGVSSPVQQSELPPHIAEFAFYLLVRDRNKRATMLGDLAEQYVEVLEKFGPRMATVFYWQQTILSFGPLLWQTITNVVQVYRWFAK